MRGNTSYFGELAIAVFSWIKDAPKTRFRRGGATHGDRPFRVSQYLTKDEKCYNLLPQSYLKKTDPVMDLTNLHRL
jgi:hypothetical protein